MPREQLLAALQRGWGKGLTATDMVDARPETLSQEDMGDHLRRRIAYNVDKDERITGYLLLPKNRGAEKHPLIMCPHPTHRTGKDMVVGKYDTPPKDKTEEYKRSCRCYGAELARRGYICFAPDTLGFGERGPLTNDDSVQRNMAAAHKALANRVPGWSSHGKAIWDLRRAIDFLVQMPEVDPDRVATIGHSLGGWYSLWLAGADTRIKAAVVNAGGNLAFRKELYESSEALEAYLSGKSQQMHVNASLWVMAIAPRPLLYMKALNDLDNPDYPNYIDGFRHMSHFYQQLAPDKTKASPFAAYVHNQGHSFDMDARQLAYHWLDIQLKHAPTTGAGSSASQRW